jgi:hypothetical protein
MARGWVCWFGSQFRNDRPAPPRQPCCPMDGSPLIAAPQTSGHSHSLHRNIARRRCSEAALLLCRQPGLGHRALDDVPLNPVASRTTECSQVLAERTRLNRRQSHRRTASRALRPLVLYIEHRLPLTFGGSATELSVTDSCRCGAVMRAPCSPGVAGCWSISLSLQNLIDRGTHRNGPSAG